MKRAGFTLIEMIVVVAIISIMAGIMAPLAYRAWETNEVDSTKERMNALKIAMVGDPRLVQNGVRTNFGYVGDVGQLPASLDDIVSNMSGVANWNGPYLQTGFGADGFKKDAWRNQFSYSTNTDAFDRKVSATLTSYGSDGVAGNTTGVSTADDITLTIPSNETVPTKAVQGNIQIAFSTAPQSALNYSAKVFVKYRNGLGGLYENFACVPVAVAGSPGSTTVNYADAFTCNMQENLPVGAAVFRTVLFSDAACATQLPGQSSSELIVNVNDRVSLVTANLQVTVQ